MYILPPKRFETFGPCCSSSCHSNRSHGSFKSIMSRWFNFSYLSIEKTLNFLHRWWNNFENDQSLFMTWKLFMILAAFQKYSSVTPVYVIQLLLRPCRSGQISLSVCLSQVFQPRLIFVSIIWLSTQVEYHSEGRSLLDLLIKDLARKYFPGMNTLAY